MARVDRQTIHDHVATVRLAAFLLRLLGAAMVWGTERLPVAPIPEQPRVATVRDLVVDDGGRCNAPQAFAEDAQRIGRQE